MKLHLTEFVAILPNMIVTSWFMLFSRHRRNEIEGLYDDVDVRASNESFISGGGG